MTREERARELLTAAGFPENASTRAAVNYETVIAHMLAFADAEAAAMRERAAECAASADTWKHPYAEEAAERIAAAIRALPATGEVGRE